MLTIRKTDIYIGSQEQKEAPTMGSKLNSWAGILKTLLIVVVSLLMCG